MSRLVGISIALGVLVTVSGFVLGELGGWGPCGPASDMSYIGGILCGILLSEFIPVPPILSILIVTCIWSWVAFILLGLLFSSRYVLKDKDGDSPGVS
jgi:hypothetical protein